MHTITLLPLIGIVPYGSSIFCSLFCEESRVVWSLDRGPRRKNPLVPGCRLRIGKHLAFTREVSNWNMLALEQDHYAKR